MTSSQTKPSSDRNHGHGIHKIQEICEKYDGTFEQKTQNNLVTTTVYLPI